MRDHLSDLILAGLIRLFARPAPSGRKPAADLEGGRILILSAEHQVGSAVNLTPIFPALRQHYPKARITIAGFQTLTDVVCHSPHWDELITLPNPDRGLWPMLVCRVAGAMRDRGGYDLVLCTPGCRRRNMAFLALTAGGRRVVGFGPDRAADYFSSWLAYQPDLGTMANNLALPALLGARVTDPDPCIHYPSKTAAMVRDWLKDGHWAGFAVLSMQTSGGQPTQWPLERVAPLALGLYRRLGLRPVFVGTPPGASAIAASVRNLDIPVLDLIGQTDLPGLAALFAGADLALTLDSGPLHVARAARVPHVMIASAWESPLNWLPPAAAHRRLLSHRALPCAPCGQARCPHDLDCLTGIGVDQVLDEAAVLMDSFPPSPAARRARLDRFIRDGGSVPG